MTEDEDLKFIDDSDEEVILEEESDFKEITSYTVGNSVRTIVNMIDIKFWFSIQAQFNKV